jgi:23S rRNA G2445 N2-methylase RlmL
MAKKKAASKNAASEQDDNVERFTLLLLTDAGCEEACAREVKELLGQDARIAQHVVAVDGSLLDAALLAYHVQTARRILVQLAPPQESLDAFETLLPDERVRAACLPKNWTFKAEGDVLALLPDDTEPAALPMAQELVEAVGGWLHRHGQPVKLSAPDATVYAIVTRQRVYVGVDVVGRSMAKREYRIMLSRRSLKATIAAAAVVYAGITHKDRVLDPIADDGTIIVECGIRTTHVSPMRFQKDMTFLKFPGLAGTDWQAWRAHEDERREAQLSTAFGASVMELKAIRTHAKLASVEKAILTTKVSVDWMDVKLEAKSLDHVITQPIVGGKSLAPKAAAALLSRLFEQAAYVLTAKGTFTAVTEKPQEVIDAAKPHGFVLAEQHDVLMGKRPMSIVLLKKAKKTKA